MSNLPLGEFTKYGRERPVILIDKIMQMNGRSSTIHTDNGTLECDGIIINGVKTLRTPGTLPSKAEELINELASMQGNTAGQKSN